MMFYLRLLPQLLSALLLSALSGCTWIHMTPGANSVRVLDTAPAGCEKRGEIVVEVKHSIAFIERNALKVRDELEVLARNEAPGLHADAIHPLAEPDRGKQRFVAWQCGR